MMKTARIFIYFFVILFIATCEIIGDLPIVNISKENKFLFKVNDTLVYSYKGKDSLEYFVVKKKVLSLDTFGISRVYENESVTLCSSNSCHGFLNKNYVVFVYWRGFYGNVQPYGPTIKLLINRDSIGDLHECGNMYTDLLPTDTKKLFLSLKYGPVRIIYNNGDTLDFVGLRR